MTDPPGIYSRGPNFRFEIDPPEAFDQPGVPRFMTSLLAEMQARGLRRIMLELDDKPSEGVGKTHG